MYYFHIYRSHDVNKESHDMAWYVWTEEENELLRPPSWKEGEGLAEAVANITLKIEE